MEETRTDQGDPGEKAPGGPQKWEGWRASFLVVAAGMVLAEFAGLSAFLDGRPMGAAATLRFLAVLGGTLAFLWYSWPRIRPLFRSLKFGITVLIFLLFASIVGTLFAQRSDSSEGGFKSTFLQAEAEFVWNLTHPFFRFSSPPKERKALETWLRERGIARPEAVTAGLLLGPDLEAQARIFGKRSADETWKRERSRIVQAVQNAGTRRQLALHSSFYQGLFEIAESLEFTTLWKSDWFAALVILLFLSMGLNLFRPGRVTWRKLGFWGAHGGVLLAILGAAIGRRFEVRGSLPMRVGDVADRFWSKRPDPDLPGRSRFRDGLALKLAAFRALPHYRLQVGVMPGGSLESILPRGIDARGYMESVKIHQGRVLGLLKDESGKPRWKITLEEFLPRVRLRQVWGPAGRDENPGDGRKAMVRLSRRDPRTGRVLQEVTLAAPPGRSVQRFLPGGKRLVLAGYSGKADLNAWKQGEGLGKYGKIRLRGKGGKWVEIPLEEGARARVKTPEGELEVLVWRVMQAFDLETWGGRKGIFGKSLEKFPSKVNPAPDRDKNRLLPPLNPAVALVAKGPKGIGGFYVFSRGGHREGLNVMPVPGKAVYSSLQAEVEYDEIRCPAMERLLFLLGPAGAFGARVVGEKVVEVKPLEAGMSLELGSREWKVDKFYLAARSRWVVDPLPEKGRRFTDDPAALKVAVEGPSGRKTYTLVSTTASMEQKDTPSPLEQVSYGKNLLLRLVENRDMPQEWWSRLAVYRLSVPKGMTRDGLTAAIPVLDQGRWKKFLAALKEAGADAAPLESGAFRERKDRAARVEELSRALDAVLGKKDASFWLPRLPKDLFVPLSEWVARGGGKRLFRADIRVNDPLMIPVRGIPSILCAYQVNQSDARADRPDYSGFQVIWDPGVNLVKLGLVLIALGTFLLFLAIPMRRGFGGKEAA